MRYSQLGAMRLVGYNHLISSKRGRIIVLLKTPTKYRKFFPTLFVKTTDFQLVFNFEQTRTVTIFGEHDIMAHIATDTEVNNCFSKILKQWDNWAQTWWLLTHLLLPTITILARNDRTAAVVASSCRQIKLLKAFVYLLRGNFFQRSCEFLYLKLFC